MLDTETTGLSAQHGHRLTEIGCVEIINRRITGKTFQTHLNPERELDERAAQITGLNYSMLKSKPKFKEVAQELTDFIGDSELIIHNAPFDLSFLAHEFNLIKHAWSEFIHELQVIDTLLLSREMHPGQRNSLDALCKRYAVDNSHRNFHGALLDAQILAHVYLAMTAGQTSLDLNSNPANVNDKQGKAGIYATNDAFTQNNLTIIYANEEELAEHAALLAEIRKE